MDSIGAGVTSVRLATELDWNGSTAALEQTLNSWLRETYRVDLATGPRDGLEVEWLISSPSAAELCCHLSVADDESGTSRSLTFVVDDFADARGALVLLDEEPLKVTDPGRYAVDVSQPTAALLRALIRDVGTSTGAPQRLEVVRPASSLDLSNILRAAEGELAPGLLLVVVDEAAGISGLQQDLVDKLLGLVSVVVATPEDARSLCSKIGVSGEFRAGSVISIARAEGVRSLDAQILAAFMLRRQPDAVRRLIMRHQSAAPRPFSIEQRRNLAMKALRGSGADEDMSAAEQLLDEASRRVVVLEQQLKNVQFDLEWAWEEQDEALKELDAAQSRNRFLQRALQELDSVPVETEPEQDWTPDSCVEAILAARDELTFLVISCLDDPTRKLDQHPKRRVWATKIWSTFRGLNDYARARVEGVYIGDLHSYRQDPPAASIPILCEYAAKESESTSNDSAARTARIFRVPPELRSDRLCYMEAHLKIDRGGSVAPRVHLYDDSAGPTQRIHIGYVGPHLPTGGR